MHFLYLIRYPTNVLVFLTDFSKNSIPFSLFLEIVLKFTWWDHTSKRVDKLKITLYHFMADFKKDTLSTGESFYRNTILLTMSLASTTTGTTCTLMENLAIFNATVFKYAVTFTEFKSLKTSIFVFSNQFAKWWSKIGTKTV